MFPGISVAYTDYEEACLTLDEEVEISKAPRAVLYSTPNLSMNHIF